MPEWDEDEDRAKEDEDERQEEEEEEEEMQGQSLKSSRSLSILYLSSTHDLWYRGRNPVYLARRTARSFALDILHPTLRFRQAFSRRELTS